MKDEPRDLLHKKITKLDQPREMKEALNYMINFIDQEDEKMYFKLKKELTEELGTLKSRVGEVEE